jgi:hypothetical protein
MKRCFVTTYWLLPVKIHSINIFPLYYLLLFIFLLFMDLPCWGIVRLEGAVSDFFFVILFSFYFIIKVTIFYLFYFICPSHSAVMNFYYVSNIIILCFIVKKIIYHNVHQNKNLCHQLYNIFKYLFLWNLKMLSNNKTFFPYIFFILLYILPHQGEARICSSSIK